MAFCPKCGSRVDDGDRFCDNCGNPIQAAPNSAPNPTPAPTARPTSAPYTPPVSNPYAPAYNPVSYARPVSKAGKILTIIAICTAAVAFISFFMPLVVDGSFSFTGADFFADKYSKVVEKSGALPFAALSVILSVVSVVMASLSFKGRAFKIVALICSAIATFLLPIALTLLFEEEYIEYMSVGLVLYINCSLATAVLSGVSLGMKSR